MRRLRRLAIVSGVVGLSAFVLGGVGAQEAPQPAPCDTIAEAPPASVPDAVPTPLPAPAPPATVPSPPSSLPPAPVETPTPATLPETLPPSPCQTTTTSTLPPLEDDDEEYWDEFIAGVAPPGSVGIVLPSGGPVDTGTGGFAFETGAVPPAPVRSADTTDVQPIASGEGGFRYALVFALPLLILLAAAAVAWTLTQPVTVPAHR